jgi:hypothetical protein
MSNENELEDFEHEMDVDTAIASVPVESSALILTEPVVESTIPSLSTFVNELSDLVRQSWVERESAINGGIWHATFENSLTNARLSAILSSLRSFYPNI